MIRLPLIPTLVAALMLEAATIAVLGLEVHRLGHKVEALTQQLQGIDIETPTLTVITRRTSK